MIFQLVRPQFRPLITAAAGLFALLLCCQCTHTTPHGDDAEGLYQEAEDAFKDGRYLMAIERFRDVKNRFPYSSRATDAELRIADTYFEQESYIEAQTAYEVFLALHPTHPKADYVWYRMGLSYYNQIPSNTARDLSAAYKAIETFEQMMAKFPASSFAPKAKEHIAEVRGKLAEHEQYVADFYFRREHYLSASYRYSALLKDFGDLGFGEESLYRLGICYENMKMRSNARDALLRLIKQFPESDYRSEAQAKLDELK